MTFGSECSISKAKVDLKRVPVYVENCCLNYCYFGIIILSDLINLTQVHNFTVSAQDIFTFRRHSIFTVSFTGILQLFMQIMKRFVLSY